MDIKNKVRESEREYQQYKRTDHLIYLQQAGNKIFSAVENYMMVKYHQRHKSYEKVKEMITDNADSKLLVDGAQLHYFFYNSDLQMSRYDAETIFKSVLREMKRRLRWNIRA